jgi:hypothetical protein
MRAVSLNQQEQGARLDPGDAHSFASYWCPKPSYDREVMRQVHGVAVAGDCEGVAANSGSAVVLT